MWKYFLIHCIINILFIVFGNGDKKIILPDDNYEKEAFKFTSIANCIIAISDQELYFRPTIAILEQAKEGAENTFINKLIDKVTEYSMPQLILKDVQIERYHDLLINALTVVFLNKCDDVNNFDFKSIDRAMRFLIIISDHLNDGCVKKLEEIGELINRNAVTFIIQDFRTDINKVYTVFPKIDARTCKEVVEIPAHINTCFNGTIQNRDIFPTKNPGNLNKCPFRVGMATLFPFSTIVGKEFLKDYDLVERIEGSDFEIMKIVNEHFNATLDVHYIFRKEENPFGDIHFLDFVLNGSLDACAGGLYRIYGNIVEYSGTYVRQGVFWIYYAERPDRSWQHLVSKLNDVYLFFIFYFAYSCVWCLISLFDGNSASLITTLVHSWGAIVGATTLQDARTNKQKILNFMYLVLCIYSSTYISIQFYSFLTITAPPDLLKTNTEVMESGRTPYLKNSSKFFMSDEKYVKFAKTSEDCVSFDECAEKAFKYNGLTLILQGNFYRFQAATAVNDEARVLKVPENTLTVFNEMLIRKDSSLVVQFQNVVQRLFEAGITKRLFTKAIGITWVARSTIANSNMISSSYSCQVGCSITLTQFAGVFYAWIFGCVISCFVFIIELFKRVCSDCVKT